MLTTVRNPDDVTGNLIYMNFTAVHPNGTMDGELASAIAKLGGSPYVGATKNLGAAPPPAPVSAVPEVNSTIFYPAPMLPDLDGSDYPPHTLVFQPGECTRNDGSQHPLPPQPAPAPPPAPHQCSKVIIHHTEGCFNYSDWKQGTPGKKGTEVVLSLTVCHTRARARARYLSLSLSLSLYIYISILDTKAATHDSCSRPIMITPYDTRPSAASVRSCCWCHAHVRSVRLCLLQK